MTERHNREDASTKSPRHGASREDVLAWVGESSPGGVAVVSEGHTIYQNCRFDSLLSASEAALPYLGGKPHHNAPPWVTKARVVTDAAALADNPIGTRQTRRYRGGSPTGQPLTYQGQFVVVPIRSRRAVLIVIEDITERDLAAAEATLISRFQSVIARIASLAVSGVAVEDVMQEAATFTAEVLEVELCKILIPRESDEHLYLVAGVGWREGLIGSLTVEGGTHSQAGFAIRERCPVIVRDMRTETRFTPSKLLAEHGGISGMSVPMMVEERVHGVMGAHCKHVRDFTEKELEFLCSVANMLATVLERWRWDRTQLQLYHRLFELAQDGIMLTDTQGRVLEWNPAMERMTGWTREEVLQRTPDMLKSGKQPPEFYDQLWQTVTSGKGFADRVVQRRKDGSEFLVWESMSPVKDPDGRIRYFLAILTDLTERERMLEALRHTEQVKLIGQLAGGILHEIRNPLVGIGGLAMHIVEHGTAAESIRQKCRLIAQEASRIDEILESHLTQLSPSRFAFRSCDLPLLLEETLALLRAKLESTCVTVIQNIPAGLPSIEASPDHLKQVWLNVVMNAIEAMPNGGELSIAMTEKSLGEPGVFMTFRDTGHGITPEVLGRIYEPFFTSGKAKGVGLGITLSCDIIERHGGQFVITSPPGAGAVVEIWLPKSPGYAAF